MAGNGRSPPLPPLIFLSNPPQSANSKFASPHSGLILLWSIRDQHFQIGQDRARAESPFAEGPFLPISRRSAEIFA